MFAAFIWTFSALVSFYASWYFYGVWKKSALAAHGEFMLFFLILGVSFLMFDVPFFAGGVVAGVSAETGLFLIVLSFAFVLRSFFRFQGITFFSPAFVTATVAAIATAKFIFGLYLLPSPEIRDNLLYLHYSAFSAIGHGILVFFFALAVAVALFSNLKNVKKHRRSLFMLGIAFFIGGLSGVFLSNFNTFGVVFFGYILLLTTFTLAFLVVISLKRRTS